MIKPFGFALFRNGTFSGFYASKSAASRHANKHGGEVRPVADQAELDALDASLHERYEKSVAASEARNRANNVAFRELAELGAKIIRDGQAGVL